MAGQVTITTTIPLAPLLSPTIPRLEIIKQHWDSTLYTVFLGYLRVGFIRKRDNAFVLTTFGSIFPDETCRLSFPTIEETIASLQSLVKGKFNERQ